MYTMRRYLAPAVFFLLTAFAAFAVVQGKGTVDTVNSPKPQWFQSGVYLGSAAKNPLSDVKNKQAYHLCGTLVEDLGSTGGTMSAIDTYCVESAAKTITGCAFNDQVTLGIDQALPNAFGVINAYVSAADTVKVRACGIGITDGGSFNMPDASYTICCDGD